MAAQKVIRAGREPDPAKRLRQAWGSALREERERRQWSLDEVARQLGGIVTAAAIGMWERGETAPRWHHQVAIARLYAIPHHRLFAITDEVA